VLDDQGFVEGARALGDWADGHDAGAIAAEILEDFAS
jgi:hypothetical protein